MSYITIALAKGRLADLSMDLLEHCGIDCSEARSSSRKLIFDDDNSGVRLILVKPVDVPTYVDHGAADIGIAGSDTIMEYGGSLYEMSDLGFGCCRMVVAGPDDKNGGIIKANMRVATKYPNIAADYFRRKGQTVDIIKLNGSVELGPLVGLSDVIVDLVETGSTLKENGLHVIDEVCQVSARLIVNRASLKTKHRTIMNIVEAVKAFVQKGE